MTPPRAPDPPAEALDGLVVLHVEDDPNDVFFVAHAFGKIAPAVQLRRVSDGEEAVRYLRGEAPYDDRAASPAPMLVLMDVKLPKRNGLEVLEWMRAEPALASLPVVVLSSSTEPSDIARAYALGANAYVAKRSDLRELIELVRGITAYAALAATAEAIPPRSTR